MIFYTFQCGFYVVHIAVGFGIWRGVRLTRWRKYRQWRQLNGWIVCSKWPIRKPLPKFIIYARRWKSSTSSVLDCSPARQLVCQTGQDSQELDVQDRYARTLTLLRSYSCSSPYI